jgi:hypothetical protein
MVPELMLTFSASSDEKPEMPQHPDGVETGNAVDFSVNISSFVPKKLLNKSRSSLQEKHVVEIFQHKIRNSSASSLQAHKISASSVAQMYGVSEKTIRDIWNGRTWKEETWHLDMTRPMCFKTQGRPKGSKDREPRKSKWTRVAESMSSREIIGKSNLSRPSIKSPRVSAISGSHICRTEKFLDDVSIQPTPVPCKGHVGEDDFVFFFGSQPRKAFPVDSSEYSKPKRLGAPPKYIIDDLLSQWSQYLSNAPRFQDPFERDWPYLRV